MSGIVRHARLESRKARALLPRGRQFKFQSIGAHTHLGWQWKPDKPTGRWIFRRYLGNERYQVVPLGLADDTKEADGNLVLSYGQACEKAFHLPEGKTLTERIQAKFNSAIEPQCYLYRHYDIGGDLLYVGISLEPLRRQHRHFGEAAWANAIYQILIEPFATREEALAAEQLAIRTEFPKFNTTYNGRRSPLHELARITNNDSGTPAA